MKKTYESPVVNTCEVNTEDFLCNTSLVESVSLHSEEDTENSFGF